MKIGIYALLAACIASALAEYPRFKLRAPPPPRPPQHPYAKKWQQPPPPQRLPVRSRPIPVHMPPQHKIQMGLPPGMMNNNRPVAPPVRSFWKNTQTTFRTPVEKKPYHGPIPQQQVHLPEKTSFLSSPSINAQEYDFHLQTNAIPNHINTIKQVGEKGPIHTIPAPNLSLADKPVVVEEVKHVHHGADTSSYVQIQKSHQYQVTETPEHQSKLKLYRNQLQQQQQQQQLFQKSKAAQQQQQAEIYLGEQQQFQKPKPVQQNTEAFLGDQQQKEIYQLLNAYPQQQSQQQQILESYAIPVVQQQPQAGFIQQFPNSNYQMLLAQTPQLFQPDQDYVQQQIQQLQQSQQAADKISVQPEYHSFNYEEQSNKESTKKELSSLVTSSYNLEPEVEASETIHATLHRNNNALDTMAQSQYVQNYFDTRDDNVNNVEPDAKPSQEVREHKQEQVEGVQQQQQHQQEQNEEEEGYYVRLPNKQAADSLASLQAAGKINSNLMELSKKREHNRERLPIYVPDESGSQSNEGSESDEFSKHEEYDDYSQEQEEGVLNDDEQSNTGFGHKITPKRN